MSDANQVLIRKEKAKRFTGLTDLTRKEPFVFGSIQPRLKIEEICGRPRVAVLELLTRIDSGDQVRVILTPHDAAAVAFRINTALAGQCPRYDLGLARSPLRTSDIIDRCEARNVWSPAEAPTTVFHPQPPISSDLIPIGAVVPCGLWKCDGPVSDPHDGYWSIDYASWRGHMTKHRTYFALSHDGQPVARFDTRAKAEEFLARHWKSGFFESTAANRDVRHLEAETVTTGAPTVRLHHDQTFTVASLVGEGVKPHQRLAVTPATEVTPSGSSQRWIELVTFVPLGDTDETLDAKVSAPPMRGYPVYLSQKQAEGLAAEIQENLLWLQKVDPATDVGEAPLAAGKSWRERLSQEHPVPNSAPQNFPAEDEDEREDRRGYDASVFSDDLDQVPRETQELLLAKNRRYGDAALSPVRIMSSASRSEQIRVRIDDKLSRLTRGSGEETEDVVTDLLGYFVLLKISELREARGE